MLLQTNSYIVPKDRRAEHARLLQRFRQTLGRLGCEHFETYEQVGANWSGSEATGRFVQIMRFNDRKHQQEVQNAEKTDPAAQQLIREFCELINFPYQQQQGLFAVGYYNGVLHGSRTGARPQAVAPAANEPPSRAKASDAEASIESDASMPSDTMDDLQSDSYEPVSQPPTEPARDVTGHSPADELVVEPVGEPSNSDPLDIDALLDEPRHSEATDAVRINDDPGEDSPDTNSNRNRVRKY